MTQASDHQDALDAVTAEMEAVSYVLGDLAGLGSDPDFSALAVNRLYNRYTTRYAHLHARWQVLKGQGGSPARVRVLAGGGLDDAGPLLAVADRPPVSERPGPPRFAISRPGPRR